MNAYSIAVLQRTTCRLTARNCLGVGTSLGRLAAAAVEAGCLSVLEVRVGSARGCGREGRDSKEQGRDSVHNVLAERKKRWMVIDSCPVRGLTLYIQVILYSRSQHGATAQ